MKWQKETGATTETGEKKGKKSPEEKWKTGQSEWLEAIQMKFIASNKHSLSTEKNDSI